MRPAHRKLACFIVADTNAPPLGRGATLSHSALYPLPPRRWLRLYP